MCLFLGCSKFCNSFIIYGIRIKKRIVIFSRRIVFPILTIAASLVTAFYTNNYGNSEILTFLWDVVSFWILFVIGTAIWISIYPDSDEYETWQDVRDKNHLPSPAE